MINRFAIALVLGLAVSSSQAPGNKPQQMDLPRELAEYRRWPQLLKVPYQVPLELYVRCVIPRPEDWNEARKQYGPHTETFIRVYGNELATEAFKKKRELPVGSIIAKEKYQGVPQGSADGVGFMVKTKISDFPESGGWQFLYYPAHRNHSSDQSACAPCHQAAKASDHVFGKYPRED